MLAYVSGDILEGAADMIVDITNMPQFSDESFDFIILNHVLEHISDENKAVHELLRVLKRNGRIMFSFPLCLGEETLEDKSNSLSRKERLRLFGQEDHVRLYGEKDVIERFERYGITVHEYIVNDYLTPEDIKKLHFMNCDRIYIGSKEEKELAEHVTGENKKF